MKNGRSSYDDVVMTTPVTVPYVRYSLRGAHWFLAGALAETLKQSGLAKAEIDGLCVSSFALRPTPLCLLQSDKPEIDHGRDE
jgi:hypothetical protein